MAADFIAQLLASADALSLSELETASCRLIEIRNSKTPLFRLPGELRNRIWRMALIEDIRSQHETFRDEAVSIAQERKEKALTTGTSTAAILREVADRRAFGDDHVGNIFKDMMFQREIKIIALPTFHNTTRQMKTEVESILYNEVMIWDEYDHLFRTWKQLLPYQMGGLFNIRKHGVPLLKLRKEYRANDIKTLVVVGFGTTRTFDPRRYPPARRGGRVRFAEELKLENLGWSIGNPYLVTEAASTGTPIRNDMFLV
ncbi:uncharacterized protein RHO25_004249 [Cercospora beticola]|uniref:Uncharacterized protein n=1 Tax=Cercospora beticola TaxID=122368 RepID=A0ABZ0NJA3_CERBT|nr:hypothetical protein RHO25_004249 [Cercospora beticola]